MKTFGELKQMMSSGDTVKAAETLKEVLEKMPCNLQARMLYGTCCQLLGDEETFKRIHEELAPEMAQRENEEPQSEAVSLWKKYHALWRSLIVGGLVLAGTGIGGCMSPGGRVVLYGGPEYDGPIMESRVIRTPTRTKPQTHPDDGVTRRSSPCHIK